MCLMGGFLEVRRLFHLSGAPHRSGYDKKVKKTDCSRKLKRVWVGTSGGFRRVRRALDFQECVRT